MATVQGAPAADYTPEAFNGLDPARLVVVEHYQDDEPTEPKGYERYFERVKYLRNGQELDYWATVVFDSVTSMDMLARAWYQYVLNPAKDKQGNPTPLGLHDTRPWRAGATDTLEQNLYLRVGAWRCNVVTIAHIDEEKDEVNGTFIRNPAAPGRLHKRLPPGYNELYHMYGTQGPKGEDLRAIQTTRDAKMNAGTSIDAPSPCWPTYESLWQNYTGARRSLHCLVYGDAFIGKSTFAATWPKPMLVLMFDGFGKDAPYQKTGDPVDEYVDGFGTYVQRVQTAT